MSNVLLDIADKLSTIYDLNEAAIMATAALEKVEGNSLAALIQVTSDKLTEVRAQLEDYRKKLWALEQGEKQPADAAKSEES